MRTLLIIWLLVLVTLIGGTVYMNHAINNMLLEARSEPVTGFSSLQVVSNYQEQKTAHINILEPKVSDVYLQNTYGKLQGSLNESN